MEQVVVHKGRTTIVALSLGYDVSADTITSQIREGKSKNSPLIATWIVTFADDGSDGEVVLTLDDTVSSAIEQVSGYMDVKRNSGGEPLAVFDSPLEVVFREVVTE